MSTQVALKISYNGDIHRARVDLRAFAFADLAQFMLSTFRLSPGAFVIQYVDPEGDRVNVTSDADFAEACRVFLGGNQDAAKTLKFVAVSRRQVEFQESVADPLVSSIEQLITALQATVDKVKRDSVGIASDVHEAVSDAKKSIQELPVDQVLRDTTDGVKTASTGFSSFASGLVGEIKRFIPEKKPAAATSDAAAAPAAPVVSEPEVAVPAPVAVAAPVPVEPTPVAEAEPAPVAEPVVEEAQPTAAAAAAAAVAFSDAEVKWAEELSVVRNIVPDVDVARVIDMLEKSDGNINVVMNVLMEDN